MKVARRHTPRTAVLSFVAASLLVTACRVPNPTASQRIAYPTTVTTARMVRTSNDVPYGTSPSEVLDVYRPARPNGVALLWIHGGGWADSNGNTASLASEEPSGMSPLVPSLFRLGYTVISVRYAGTDEGAFPEPLIDLKLAVRWVKVHAADLGVRSDSLVAMGFSAGGHLAAMLGTTAGAIEPTNLADDMAAVDSSVAAVVSLNGVLDPATFPLSGGIGDSNASAVAALVGCPSAPALWRRCNPAVLASTRVVAYADPSDAPMYVVAGDSDGIVVPQYQAYEPVKALTTVLGADRVWFDLIDTGSAARYGGFNPRNHSLAAAYEVNMMALKRFLATEVPALT